MGNLKAILILVAYAFIIIVGAWEQIYWWMNPHLTKMQIIQAFLVPNIILGIIVIAVAIYHMKGN